MGLPGKWPAAPRANQWPLGLAGGRYSPPAGSGAMSGPPVMARQKDNGPDAENDRPAKKYDFNATNFIALCTRPASHAGIFRTKPCHGIGQSPKSAKTRCDTIHPGATMHHGLGGPIQGATAAPFIGQRLYFFSTPCCAGRMASFMTGCVGASARVRRSLSGPPTSHSLSPLLGGKGAVLTLSQGAKHG